MGKEENLGFKGGTEGPKLSENEREQTVQAKQAGDGKVKNISNMKSEVEEFCYFIENHNLLENRFEKVFSDSFYFIALMSYIIIVYMRDVYFVNDTRDGNHIF